MSASVIPPEALRQIDRNAEFRRPFYEAELRSAERGKLLAEVERERLQRRRRHDALLSKFINKQRKEG